ncbi:DUF1634 domain-containing protein [Archaeoglobus veneficus]|uniref:DUF1634 domain-containing protein n=1 Tax=Archaeoglobus veneficus (strain DSM 11195 / SNP6) TaxID=693661 RepID=F2KPV3_ARCVS|nr:DUF1634 domain-containing protein [Archaeoglobus veneficus]AEA46460.1 hypothetical protein Arcve_0428 [Archaeoglobus veneficus SNP6]
MGREEAPKPPLAGVVYGEIAYWMVIVGMVIAIAGSFIYLTSGGYVDSECLLAHLWAGADVHTIWEECAGIDEVPHGHWYLGMLGYGDAIAMLGIAIACLAAVVGMWGSVAAMFKEKEMLFAVFALVVAVILTLAAMGVITLKH